MRFQDFSGGDKRDRTADLMTASCDLFVILSVFTSNPSVESVKSAGFCGGSPIVSIRFRAHLGHNLGQGSGEIWRIPEGAIWDYGLRVADRQAVSGRIIFQRQKVFRFSGRPSYFIMQGQVRSKRQPLF